MFVQRCFWHLLKIELGESSKEHQMFCPELPLVKEIQELLMKISTFEGKPVVIKIQISVGGTIFKGLLTIMYTTIILKVRALKNKKIYKNNF